MEVIDYSHLDPETARSRINHYQQRLFAEQFHQNFFIKPVDTWEYLRYEIQALMEGRIQEFHGVTDLLGQIKDYIYDYVVDPLTTVVTQVVTEIPETLGDIAGDISSIFTKVVYEFPDTLSDLGTNISDIYGYVRYTIPNTLDNVWDVLQDIGSTIYNQVTSALDNIKPYLQDLWEEYIKPGVSNIVGAYEHLWDSINSVVQNVQEKAIKVFDWVKDIYNTMVTNFSDVMDRVKKIWDELSDVVDDVVSRVTNKIQGIVDTVSSAIDDVIDSIKPMLEGVKTTITSAISDAIGGLEDWITEVRDYIINQVKSAIQGLSKAVSDIWNNITKALDGLWGDISGAFSDLRTWVTSNVVKPIQQAVSGVSGTLQDAWDDITKTVSGTFETLSKQVAALPQSIAAGFESAISYMSEVLKGFWNDVLVPFGKEIKEDVQGVLDQVGNTLWEFFSGFYNSILNMGPTNPAVAKDNLPMIVKMSLEGAVGLGGMTLLGETLQPLKNMGLGRISAMLFDATNYNLITGAAIGALATAAFGQPLKYAFNEVFRPYLLTWGDYHELHSRGMLSESDLQDAIKFYGYPDEFRSKIDELAITPLRRTDLRYVARYGYYDPDQYQVEIQRMGHSELGAQTIHRIAQGEYMESVRRYYVDYIWDRYAMGITTKEEVRQEIASFGFPEPMREPLVQVADLQRDTEHVKDMEAAIKYSYRHGKIDLDEFKAQLGSLGLDSQKIKDLALVESMRAYEERYQTQYERVRVYGDSIVRRRYREGVITDAEFKEEMKTLGYSESWIKRYLIAAKLERDYDFAREAFRAVQDAREDGRIDDQRYIELLKSYGFDPEKISFSLSVLKLKEGLGG